MTVMEDRLKVKLVSRALSIPVCCHTFAEAEQGPPFVRIGNLGASKSYLASPKIVFVYAFAECHR